MKRFVLIACFLIAACGFQPLYQNTNTLTGGASRLDNVWINTIPNASGLFLRNALIDRFYNNGMPADAPYRLDITLEEMARDLAIRKNDTTTRAQIIERATYTLTEKATGRVVDTGQIRAVASYDILSSQYTTLVTQSESQQQALNELADKITLRMGVVLRK